MTIYTFDQASQADANAFTTGDFLHFASGLPTDLTASYEFGSALTADRITLTLAGKSLTFNADALQQGDAIDFRTDGVSRGSIMVLGPQADSVSVFSATNKAIWTFGGDDHVVIAGAGTIHLHTGAGNDSIDVDNVVLPGGALGQTGRFLIDAGDGDDLIALHMANGPTDAWGGGGNDTIEGSAGNDHLYGNAADAIAGAVDGAAGPAPADGPRGARRPVPRGGGSAGSAAAVASQTPRPVLMVHDQGLFASRQHRRCQTSWIQQTKNPTDPQRAHDAYKPHTARRKRPRVRHQRRRSRPRNPPRRRSSHGAPSDRRRPRPGVPGPAIDHACVLPGTPSQLLARPFRPGTAPCRLDCRPGVVSRTR